jgi:two-component system C4-dicarboxylate transport sensor histidine kinase DctB
MNPPPALVVAAALALAAAAFWCGVLLAARRRARADAAVARAIEHLASAGTAQPAADPAVPPLVAEALTRTVEEWRRAREDAALAVDEAHDQGTAAAMRRLAAAVAGRFGGPLEAAETARARTERALVQGSTEATLSALADLRRALHRAERLLAAMRALAPEGAVARDAVPLEELARTACDACRARAAAEAVLLTFVPPARGAVVHADAAALAGAFEALVENAVTAAAKGGRTVRVVAGEAAEGRAEVTVEDDGPGVPDGLADRLFDPLFSTRAAGDGVGLGLPLARAVAERHGGTVVFQRRTEGGSRVVLSLPASAAGGRAGARAAP